MVLGRVAEAELSNNQPAEMDELMIFRFRRSRQCRKKTEAGEAGMTRLAQQALTFGCYDDGGEGGGAISRQLL